jgi:uncharacterized protein
VKVTLLDSGPLVAFFSRRDEHHSWAFAEMSALVPPLVTCEAVLTEACFLMARNGGRPTAILHAVKEGILRVDFAVAAEAAALESLMKGYADVPMSLADACLVRLSELHPECQVFTVDGDFRHYRRNGRQVIPLLAPW